MERSFNSKLSRFVVKTQFLDVYSLLIHSHLNIHLDSKGLATAVLYQQGFSDINQKLFDVDRSQTFEDTHTRNKFFLHLCSNNRPNKIAATIEKNCDLIDVFAVSIGCLQAGSDQVLSNDHASSQTDFHCSRLFSARIRNGIVKAEKKSEKKKSER